MPSIPFASILTRSSKNLSYLRICRLYWYNYIIQLS